MLGGLIGIFSGIAIGGGRSEASILQTAPIQVDPVESDPRRMHVIDVTLSLDTENARIELHKTYALTNGETEEEIDVLQCATWD